MINSTFVVKHYAGEVSYTIDGFLSKNNDTLSNDLTALCRSSTITLLSEIFAAKEAKAQAAIAAKDASSRPTGMSRAALEPKPSRRQPAAPVD